MLNCIKPPADLGHADSFNNAVAQPDAVPAMEIDLFDSNRAVSCAAHRYAPAHMTGC